MNRLDILLTPSLFHYCKQQNIPLFISFDIDFIADMYVSDLNKLGHNNSFEWREDIKKDIQVFTINLIDNRFINNKKSLIDTLSDTLYLNMTTLPFDSCYLTENILSCFEIKQIFYIDFTGINEKLSLFKDGFYFTDDKDYFLSLDDAMEYQNNLQKNNLLLQTINKYKGNL